MAYTVSITTALDQLRTAILTDLTSQDKVPTAIAYTFAAQQYEISADSLPLVLIEIREIKSDEKAPNITTFDLPVEVSYVLRRNATNAEIDALNVMCSFAAHVKNDPRLSFVTDSIFDQVLVETITPGEGSAHTQLDNALPDLPCAIVSVLLHLHWTEARL